MIENPSNNCFVSIASLWEMGIKASLGKLELIDGTESVFNYIIASGLDILPISPEHILASTQLIFHHRDPFDRMIIGQALHEDLVIVSRDKDFQKYEAKTIWE